MEGKVPFSWCLTPTAQTKNQYGRFTSSGRKWQDRLFFKDFLILVKWPIFPFSGILPWSSNTEYIDTYNSLQSVKVSWDGQVSELLTMAYSAVLSDPGANVFQESCGKGWEWDLEGSACLAHARPRAHPQHCKQDQEQSLGTFLLCFAFDIT